MVLSVNLRSGASSALAIVGLREDPSRGGHVTFVVLQMCSLLRDRFALQLLVFDICRRPV